MKGVVAVLAILRRFLVVLRLMKPLRSKVEGKSIRKKIQ